MSKYIPGNQKHLTLENRIYIENKLNKGTSFKDIARFLCKDPTTISKEIRAPLQRHVPPNVFFCIADRFHQPLVDHHCFVFPPFLCSVSAAC